MTPRILRTRGMVLFVFVIALEGAVFSLHLGDKLILHPHVGPLEAPGARRIAIANGSDVIEAWEASSTEERPRLYVLRFYGNADRAEHHVANDAAMLAPAGALLWGVNYPGFGGSTGPASLRGAADSGLVAYDAIAQHAGGAPIVVWGTSIGTTVALHVAAERRVSAAVLQDAPPLPQLIRGTQGLWNAWLLALPVSLQIPSSLNSIKNAHRSSAPALFVTSGADEIVPPRYQTLVYDAYAGNKSRATIDFAYHCGALTTSVQARVRELIAASAERP